ncbi:MAG: NfeD family protein [Iamia sp.]
MDDPDTWRWIWLVATGVFAGGEMLVAGSFFLAPFAVGAVIATVLAFAGAPILAQWAAFVAVSAAAFAGFRPLARRLDANAPNHPVGSTRLAGHPAVVIEAIAGDGVGLVRVDREEWRAEAEGAQTVTVGTQVTILEVRGTRLIVAPGRGADAAYLPPGLPTRPPTIDPPPDPAPPTR